MEQNSLKPLGWKHLNSLIEMKHFHKITPIHLLVLTH